MSQEECDYIADILERYITIHQLTAVIDGISEKKYRKSIAMIEKRIEKLRNGKWKKTVKKSMVSYVTGIVKQYLHSGFKNGDGTTLF